MLIGLSASTIAAETTITITPKSLNNTTAKYVTEAFDFTVDGTTFTINQVNPTSGQIKVNATAASGFTLYNTTAIDNIKTIKLYTDKSTVGTMYVQTGETDRKSVV